MREHRYCVAHTLTGRYTEGNREEKMRYIEYLKAAEKRAKKLEISPQLPIDTLVPARDIKRYGELANNELLNSLLQRFGPFGWTDGCIPLGATAFTFFQKKGIPCELVFGEVVINGCNEYDTTVDGLIGEWEKGYSDDVMNIHVWLNVGKDLVVDPAIASRLNEHYDNNFPAHQVIVGKPEQLEKKKRLKYIPMLTGAKFLERTCQIPLNYENGTISA
ncbi:hypothetical protein [Vibrio rotiferianus]|nr:hypothetical protein [Vibrio rotiferianus]